MKRLLLVYVICNLLLSVAQAQTKNYAIQSMDGNKKQKISITDIGRETAVIRYQNNKLVIHNFWSQDTVTVLKDRFIKIKYAVRGGSDLSVQNTMLVCINKGKIIVPFVAMSGLRSSLKAIDSDADTILYDEKSFYKIDIELLGDKSDNYKLLLNITDISKSKIDAKGNYHKHQKLILKFDKHSQVFYNNYKALNNKFEKTECYYPFAGKRETIKGIFPSIITNGTQVGNYVNYYINGKWYKPGKRNQLVACY